MMHAKNVLDYCKLAIDELKQVSFNDKKWPLKWFVVASILRTVCYVSHEVDCCHLRNEEKYRAYWNNKKQDAIFEGFIDSERNLAIKKIKVIDNKKVQESYLLLEDGGNLLLENGEKFLLEEELIILDGFSLYKKLDEAMEWLDKFLNEVSDLFLK